VGKEDDRIQRETQEGEQQISPRIDYASAIGISKDEEQAMLAILLDAYHRREGNEKQNEERKNKLLVEEGYTEYFAHPPSDAAADLANWAILNETYVKLKETLGQKDFEKLDAYVSREFATGPYPVSLRAKQGASTGAPKFTSFPTDVRYEFFIRHTAAEQAMVQQGKIPQRDYSLVAHLPENEQQPMLTIVLEAYEQLNENYRKTGEAVGEIRQKYGFILVRQIPPQPVLQELEQERKTIIEDTIARLKQELGEEYFNDLDAWISHRWAGGRVYTPPGTPASSAQTTATQP
jgi:hypothetical protein